MMPITLSFAAYAFAFWLALARVPLAGLRGRVVTRLEADLVVAGLEVRLLQLDSGWRR